VVALAPSPAGSFLKKFCDSSETNSETPFISQGKNTELSVEDLWFGCLRELFSFVELRRAENKYSFRLKSRFKSKKSIDTHPNVS
jgi:hypothetical protein